MTSQQIAAQIYPSIQSFLGTYTRKDGGTLKAFWYYGRKVNDDSGSSPHPPSDWKPKGIEVIVEAVPDIDLINLHGLTDSDEFHNVRVIPHGDDIGDLAEVIKRIGQSSDTPVNAVTIPANERLKINTQYLITIQKKG